MLGRERCDTAHFIIKNIFLRLVDMTSRSFSTAALCACLGASLAHARFTPDPTRFEFAPHVLQAPNMTHEICSRAVDRLIHDNVDFNTILEANTGEWKDDTFNGWERVFWEDYRPRFADDSEMDRTNDTEFKRIKDVYEGRFAHNSIFGDAGITFDDPN